MEGVRTADDYFCDYVSNQLYSLMIDAAAEYELCGFKAGFNYAANLMLSLLIAGNKGKPPKELIQIDK